jgi:hypothetical protein
VTEGDLIVWAESHVIGQPLSFAKLDELREQVLEYLLPGGGPLAELVPCSSPIEELLVDVLTSMSLMNCQDPALSWELGTALSVLGRQSEAGFWFLDAATRFRIQATAAPITDDEDEWVAASIDHAADCFERARMGLSLLALRPT